MTKKEFKERASIHTYGRGKYRVLALFFDWNNDPEKGNIGYKHMVRCVGGTTKELINDAYNFLIKNIYDNLCWYDIKEAKTDAERFKVPITMSNRF